MNEIEELKAKIDLLQRALKTCQAQAESESARYHANQQHLTDACVYNFEMALKGVGGEGEEYLNKVKEHERYRNRVIESVLKKTIQNISLLRTDPTLLSEQDIKDWEKSTQECLVKFRKDTHASKDK